MCCCGSARGVTLAFIYIPLVVIGLYAFNENVTQAWPIEKYSTKWFSVAFHDEDVREALEELGHRGARRDGDRARARHARLAWPSPATASSAAR